MAELRSTTAIGGNIVWHGGNLRFEPQGQTVRYNGYKVYTEKDKPNPHTDLTTSVVQRSGDTMTGALTFDKQGEAIRINGSRLDVADAWMYIGNATYAWKLRYQGTTSGTSGNEFIIESTNTAKKWSFNHEGDFQYTDGASTWNMIHTGNLSLIDGRYVNVSGDSMTGTLTTRTAPNNATGSMHLRFPSARSWNLQSRGADSAAALYLTSEHADKAFVVEDSAKNASLQVIVGGASYVNAVRELREAGQRVFSPNNRNISSSVTSSSTSVYASSAAAKSANDNANRRVSKTGDTMTGHLTFSNERGIRKDASYFLNFNSTDIHMSSIGDVIIEADSNDNETTRSLKLISGLNSLNIAGGTKNDASALKFNNHTVLHTGNYAGNLDGRYVNASGDTMTGDLQLGDRRLSFSTSNPDIGLSSNGDRVCVGRTTAQGFNAGNILVSNAWGDASKVPTNGMYVKGHVRVDGGITGNSSSASKWATARTITLNGDATGSVSIDGTANKTLTVAVANDSHTHDGRYYTEAESNSKFLYKAEKAADSDKLDGLHAASFARTTGTYSIRATATTKADVGLSNVSNVAASEYASSKNTIPVRDANGYLNLGWINTTSGITESAISDFYVNTNDGFIRKAKPAHVKNQLGINNIPNWSSATFDGRYVSKSGDAMAGRLVINTGNGLEVKASSGWSYLTLSSSGSEAHLAKNSASAEGVAANSLHLRPSGNYQGSLMLQPNSSMRHRTTHGYINIGSLNASYAHFETDRPDFHFSKPIRIQGEIYAGSSYNQRVYHTGYKPTKADVGLGNVPNWSTATFDGRYVRKSGDTITGGLTVRNDVMIGGGSAYNSWLTLHGGDGGAERTGISVGESGKWGSACLHMYYRGDGRGYIGMGAINGSSNAQYNALEFYYTSNNTYANGSIIASGNVTAYSDERLKRNVNRIDGALDKVTTLNGYTYDKKRTLESDDYTRETGVIAQEVLKVLPEAITVDDRDEEQLLSVSYGNMVGLLIEAIKEEKSERESLESEVRELKILLLKFAKC